MALSTAQLALRQPTSIPIVAMVMEPTDPNSDDATVTVKVSDGDLWTEPGASLLPGDQFSSVISAGLTLSESLTEPGKLTSQKSSLAAGRTVVSATDSISSTWPDLDWNGKPVTIYIGSRYRADGQKMQLHEFDVAFEGKVDRVRALGKRQFEILFADLRIAWKQALSKKRYRGFGGGLQVVPGVSDAWLHASHTASLDINGELTLFFVGEIQTLRSLSTPTPLVMNGSNSPMGVNYAMLINDVSSGDTLAFASGSQTIDSGWSVPVGSPVVLAVTVASDGMTVKFWSGEDGDDLVEVGASGVLSSSVSSGPVDGLQVGQSGGTGFSAWEIHVWDAEKSLEDLKEMADGPITNAADETSLKEAWRFSEGILIGAGPARIFGEKGVVDFSATPDSLTWESSYTGDDPDLFAGSIAGKSHAITYGKAFNVPLYRIDSQRHIFGWSGDSASNDVDQVRIKGVPMVPEHQVDAISSGDITFQASSNTITIVNSSIGSFKKYIPGQSEPSRLGQRISVFGSSLNNFTFRVAVNGISSDGLVLTVTDKAVRDETGPATTSVRSYFRDAQYRLDLARSAVTFTSNPEGYVCADLTGLLPSGGTGKWSEIFEMITGIVPDTSNLSFDPVLGFHLLPGSNISTLTVLDTLAKSSYGWWIEDPAGGGYRIGNFSAPSGTPSETFSGFQLRPEFLSVEPLNEKTPDWRFDVRYLKMWKVQNGDALAGSVSEGDRQKFSEPFTVHSSTNRSTLGKYPNSVEHPGFETWLVNTEDAVAFASLARPMVTEKHRWFRIKFGSLYALNVKLNDVIQVTWDDDSLGLDGTLCRVASREISTSSYTMNLVVYT